MRWKHSGHFIARLRRRGFVTIGDGYYSVVLAKRKSDRVIKICRCIDGWAEYAQWASENGYAGTYAPRVYSFRVFEGFYVAVMERLHKTAFDAHIGAATDDAKAWVMQQVNGWVDRYAKPSTAYVEALSPGITSFLEAYIERFANYPHDLHARNWMLAHDGRLVLVDPISNTDSATPSKRWRGTDTGVVHIERRRAPDPSIVEALYKDLQGMLL